MKKNSTNLSFSVLFEDNHLIAVKKLSGDIIQSDKTGDVTLAENVKAYIKKYSERVVYITGSVNSKGPYVFPPEVEAMNIVEVIDRAGGFNPIAKKNRVFIQKHYL